MFGPLAIPPRLMARALEDLHTVAGRLGELVESVSVLPRTEDELSANIVRCGRTFRPSTRSCVR